MSEENNFKSEINAAARSLESVFHDMAENSIVKMIITGSGGPDNHEIKESGFRFIRFLISRRESYTSGIIPNFKDRKCIHDLAKEFIYQCGTPSKALQLMYQNS